MPFTTLAGLRITVPTRGTQDWDSSFLNSFATPISTHQHTGDPDGNTLITASYGADSITGAKIRLDNNENLRGRNAADSADIDLIKVNASDLVEFENVITVPAGAVNANTRGINFSGNAIGLYSTGSDGLRLVAGDDCIFSVYNAGSNDNSILRLENAGSSTGDQFVHYKELSVSGEEWVHGRDDTDTGAFKLCQGSAISDTNNFLKVTTAGVLSFPDAEIIAPGTASTTDGAIRYNSDQGEYEGYVNGAAVPLGGNVSWKIVDNDATADGTIILKAGKRWINGVEEDNSADITTAAPSTGTDDTVRTLDASTGLRAETGTTVRNHIYWNTVDDEFATISNDASGTDDTNKYDNVDRNINTTQYAPVGYIDVTESGGGHTFANLTNYPIQSWDSFHQLQAADGWQDFTSTLINGTNGAVDYARYRRVGNSVEMFMEITWSGAGSGGTFTASAPIAKATAAQSTVGSCRWSDAGAFYTGSVVIDSSSNLTMNFDSAAPSSTAVLTGSDLGSTDVLLITISYEIDSSSGFNPIATPATEFSTDTASFVIQSSDPLDAEPIGSLYLYEYQSSSSNTLTQVTSATQTLSDMNTNGINLFGRAYNSTSTSGEPAKVGIKIGKGLNPKSINLFSFQNAGKEGPVAIEIDSASNTQDGARTAYDANTGVYYIDVGYNLNTSTTTRNAGREINGTVHSSVADAYFVLNSSATTPAVGLPKGVRAKAYLDTADQTMSAGSEAVIVFNAERSDTGNNYNTSTGLFTAPNAGTYQIDCGVKVLVGPTVPTAVDMYVLINGAGDNMMNVGVSDFPSINKTVFFQLHGEIDLSAGDTIGIYMLAATQAVDIESTPGSEDVSWVQFRETVV